MIARFLRRLTARRVRTQAERELDAAAILDAQAAEHGRAADESTDRAVWQMHRCRQYLCAARASQCRALAGGDRDGAAYHGAEADFWLVSLQQREPFELGQARCAEARRGLVWHGKARHPAAIDGDSA